MISKYHPPIYDSSFGQLVTALVFINDFAVYLLYLHQQGAYPLPASQSTENLRCVTVKTRLWAECPQIHAHRTRDTRGQARRADSRCESLTPHLTTRGANPGPHLAAGETQPTTKPRASLGDHTLRDARKVPWSCDQASQSAGSIVTTSGSREVRVIVTSALDPVSRE